MTEVRKLDISVADMTDDGNALRYIIEKMIWDTVNTVELVRVVSIGVDTVDVIPVCRKLDNNNMPVNESIVYGVRYIQHQAGDKMIDLPPEVGDVGLLLVSKRDISNPLSGVVGCNRRYNLNDGIYLGSVFGLGKEVKRKISFTEQGIDIKTLINDDKITISTPLANIELDSKLAYKNQTGDLYTTVMALMAACLAIKGTNNITLHSDSIQAFQTVQQQFEQLLKAGQ